MTLDPCNAEYIKMPRQLLIFSQSDDLIQVVDTNSYTVKPVKVATCIKQAWLQFPPKKTNLLKFTCIKQAPVLSKHIWIIPWALA